MGAGGGRASTSDSMLQYSNMSNQYTVYLIYAVFHVSVFQLKNWKGIGNECKLWSCPQMFMKHGCQVLRNRIPQPWSVMRFINICPTWTPGKELLLCCVNPYLDCKPPKQSLKAGSTIVNNLDFISSAMGVDEVCLRFYSNQLKSSNSRSRNKVFHVVY